MYYVFLARKPDDNIEYLMWTHGLQYFSMRGSNLAKFKGHLHFPPKVGARSFAK